MLAVGDLHVENFGTWRDTEGRLVWGVNDFDEVAEMPYAVDLVRLVTSAILAQRENGLAIDGSSAATAVLDGYSEFLAAGGTPFILEEGHPGLREMALGAERDPVKFWSKLTALPRRDAAEAHSATAGQLASRRNRRASPSRTASRAKGALAGRVMSRPVTAMAVWLRARRKRGCPRRGVGPKAGRSTAPMRFGC